MRIEEETAFAAGVRAFARAELPESVRARVTRHVARRCVQIHGGEDEHLERFAALDLEGE